jgi:alpha-L-rhamnosidase
MKHYITILLVVLGCALPGKGDVAFRKLLCEYAENPINIDVARPRFSWVVAAQERGQYQTACQVWVSTSAEGLTRGRPDMWDSGKLTARCTVHQEYQGKPLASDTQYFWRVEIWDRHGNRFRSEPSRFSTALLADSDWKAKWIGANRSPEPKPVKGFFMDPKEESDLNDPVAHEGRSVLLRTEFDLDKPVKTARVFVTGLGFYELMLNGRHVGDHVLAPAKTPYHRHILYDTYDVTELLSQGANAIGVHLGNGWYDPYKKWWQEYRMQWFGYKKALVQLHVTYTDGTERIIASDEHWKTARGPVLYNCVYDGEVYDANAEKRGWSKPGYDDSAWDQAVVMDQPRAKLRSHLMPPIRINEVRSPVKITEPIPGMKVYDLGQNFTGWVRVAMKGKKGTKVFLRFSEELHDDGTLDFTCNEKAKATVEYVMKGEGLEVYESRFTYFGFQYVAITADGELPTIDRLQGCVTFSANAHIGNFECSHPLINKIHHATVWSQRSNMLSYPLDCPQRDERLGWFGDAQVTAEEAMFNFDMALFYENWLRGIRANQDRASGDIPIISPRPYIKDEGVEWSSSFLTIVWHCYQYYGDKQILAENYQAMKGYMGFLAGIADNHIVPKGWIGDWGSMVEGWEEGEPESVPTAFYYYNALILQKVARVIGETADAAHFAKLARDIKAAYNGKYFDVATSNYNDGSQMANAFPLFLGIVPEDQREAVLRNIVHDIEKVHDTHLTTGVLGTKYLIDVLSMAGRSDVAWALATQTTYPSWAEMMKRFNTMCEFWTLKQSHNHVMMGSIDAWFYKTLAGIQLAEDKPAYEHFVVRPFPAEGLDYAKASIQTIKGTVASGWTKAEGVFELSVAVPFGCAATVYVPADIETAVKEGGVAAENVEGVRSLGYRDGYHVFEVQSGKYTFSCGE